MNRRDKYLAMGLLATAVITMVVVYSPFASDGAPEVEAEVDVTFRDERIDESSGLVVRGDRLYTINDSGDGPYVYAVDRETGGTVAVNVFAEETPVDLEALAPGRDGTIWVGDIGDNARVRGSIRVHRIEPAHAGGRVPATTYELAYPDRPHDAEALLVHPRTERVLVVTKRPLLGGVVYRAPEELREGKVHQLEAVAKVSGMITDGTFLPDGRHVLLRTSGGAAVYTYPDFERVAEFLLPVQDQGEGIAVGEDGRIYLSSEGEFSDVLVMDMPPLSEPEAGDAAETEPEAGEEPPAGPAPETEDGPGLGRPPGYAVAAVAGAALVAVFVRASRRRSRRRR
jgi:hypothetical protein